MRKPTIWVLTRSDKIQLVQSQKMVLDLERRGLYYLCSENKGDDQLRNYCKADLRICFAYADCWFSHAAAQFNPGMVFDNVACCSDLNFRFSCFHITIL